MTPDKEKLEKAEELLEKVFGWACWDCHLSIGVDLAKMYCVLLDGVDTACPSSGRREDCPYVKYMEGK